MMKQKKSKTKRTGLQIPELGSFVPMPPIKPAKEDAHPRYIAPEKLIDIINPRGVGDPLVRLQDIMRAIAITPTEDVAPVIHAHWSYLPGVFANNSTKGCFECSACKATIATETFDLMYECGQTKRCGSCGARMDEEEKETPPTRNRECIYVGCTFGGEDYAE